MSRFLIILLSSITLFYSCHSSRPQDLPAVDATVDLDSDTTLRTANEALVHINAQTQPHRTPSHVRLTIRHSGNLIGIDLAKGQEKLPVYGYIALPAGSFDKEMALYTGTQGHKDDIVWTKTHPLFYAPPPDHIMHGRQLFSSNCIACHSIPGHGDPDLLAGVTQRHTQQWLRDFTRDNGKLRAGGDAYANALYQQYNQTPMNTFPELSDKDIDDIYHYIDFTQYQRAHPFPDSLLQRHSGGYYQFPIEIPGWYRIDTQP